MIEENSDSCFQSLPRNWVVRSLRGSERAKKNFFTNINDERIREIFFLQISVISTKKEKNFRLLLFNILHRRAITKIQGTDLRRVRVQNIQGFPFSGGLKLTPIRNCIFSPLMIVSIVPYFRVLPQRFRQFLGLGQDLRSVFSRQLLSTKNY